MTKWLKSREVGCPSHTCPSSSCHTTEYQNANMSHCTHLCPKVLAMCTQCSQHVQRGLQEAQTDTEPVDCGSSGYSSPNHMYMYARAYVELMHTTISNTCDKVIQTENRY